MLNGEWTHERIFAEMPSRDEILRQQRTAVEECGKILSGHHPGIIGAVLCELLAIWLGGHAPEHRLEFLDGHMQGVAEMLEQIDEKQNDS